MNYLISLKNFCMAIKHYFSDLCWLFLALYVSPGIGEGLGPTGYLRRGSWIKKFINMFFFSADNGYEKSLQAKTFPVQIRRI